MALEEVRDGLGVLVAYFFQTSVRSMGALSEPFWTSVAVVNGWGRMPTALGSDARIAATSACSLFHSTVTASAMPALPSRKSRTYSGLEP